MNLLKAIFAILICTIILIPVLYAQPARDRIKNENKLIVPADKSEQVWEYLLNRLFSDKEFLKSLDPNLDSYWDTEYFEDTYFDTSEFQVLDRCGYIYYRMSFNPDDTSKGGKEVMQIKLDNINNNSLEPTEIEFKISHPAKLKRYDDAFPALGLVKRKLRTDFKQKMEELGINPYSLKEVFTIKHYRKNIYILKNGEPFTNIKMDEDSSKRLWAEWQQVEIELNDANYTEGSEENRKQAESINKKIMDDTLQKFPEIKIDSNPKYCDAFPFFEKKIPFFRFLVSSGALFY